METTTKATSDGIGYASKTPYTYDEKDYEADLQNNDKVTITDGGGMEPNQFGGENLTIKIKTRNGEKKTSVNQTSVNILNPAFGSNSDDWVGKEVNVLLHKTVIAGEKRIVCYLATEGWYLDDFGDLMIDTEPQPASETVAVEKSDGTVQMEKIQELSPEDNPF